MKTWQNYSMKTWQNYSMKTRFKITSKRKRKYKSLALAAIMLLIHSTQQWFIIFSFFLPQLSPSHHCYFLSLLITLSFQDFISTASSFTIPPKLIVTKVVCSFCGLDDIEGNDILLCDRSGCCRAYHQHCLSPAVAINGKNGINKGFDFFSFKTLCPISINLLSL